MNASEEQLFKLFVYGTLMPGESNYGLVGRHVQALDRAASRVCLWILERSLR